MIESVRSRGLGIYFGFVASLSQSTHTPTLFCDVPLSTSGQRWSQEASKLLLYFPKTGRTRICRLPLARGYPVMCRLHIYTKPTPTKRKPQLSLTICCSRTAVYCCSAHAEHTNKHGVCYFAADDLTKRSDSSSSHSISSRARRRKRSAPRLIHGVETTAATSGPAPAAKV